MSNKVILIALMVFLMLFPLTSCATGVSQEDYDSLRNELIVAQAKIRSLEASEAELQRQLSEARQSLDSLNLQLLAMQAEQDRLNTEVAMLREQLSSVPTFPFSQLRRGQYLIAQDDTYLGALDSRFTSESIFNDFGKYGSEFSSTSIWNQFSKYGSEFSSLSAFNDLASKPPMLFDGNTFICYVTTNTLRIPRVSPYSLLAFAESMGWE